jgi:hypothetical protein
MRDASCTSQDSRLTCRRLSLAKMPSGLKAFEISDIQKEQTDAGQTGTIRM